MVTRFGTGGRLGNLTSGISLAGRFLNWSSAHELIGTKTLERGALEKSLAPPSEPKHSR
jgi:hypothetical protein